MPDTRTIINVTKPYALSPDPAKQGEIHVTMSDGTDGESAGIVDREENGVGVQRVALRTVNGVDDGPLYTPFVCFMMRQLGATVPDVAPPVPIALPVPTPVTEPVTIPAVTPEAASSPAAAAPAHASRLSSIFSALHGMLHLIESPEVLALLPPKYQAIGLAVTAVDQGLSGGGAAPATAS